MIHFFQDHLTDQQLRELLFAPEEELDATQVALHVESCQTCQIRLTELADEQSIEPEVCQLLSGYSNSNRTSTSGASTTPSKEEAIPSVFEKVMLDPPSHPEMLGRLGRYEIERCIGSGGMGIVFKAIDCELNRPVAVKVLAPHLARNGAARQRFSRESRAAASVVHEHVVAIHNVDSTAEHPYLVMQYVAGESLQSRVDREGPLAVEKILRIGIQAARGLAAAHLQGIVHRDIKPANILLEDGVERLLITDFGLARTIDDASLTHTGVVAGTPNYMSPEQAQGDDVDHRTDLFSLGAVLYFVATGHPPFRAERAMGVLHRICHERHRPVWQINATIPDELSLAIDRLLSKHPSRRFSSATAVATSLTRILQQLQGRRPGLWTRLRSWERRHRSRALLASAMTVMAGLAATWLILLPEDVRLSPSNGKFADQRTRSMSTRKGHPNETPSLSLSSDSPSAATNALPPSNDGLLAMIGEERREFDQTMIDLHRVLDNLDTANPIVDANPFIDFHRELKSLDHSLKLVDPSQP